MIQQATYFEEDAMAEGLPDAMGDLEPATPLKTTTIPTINSDLDLVTHAAETGLIDAVQLGNEGRDDDEGQDASRTTDEAKLQPVPAAQRQTKTKLNRVPTVLIVEDTMELAEIIAATLERMNMVTAHETHGNKALEKFHEMNPDVILLDISLPDMTGWKIMDAIKERHETGGKMPIVIIITAYDDPANRLVGKLQGVHSYLIKPFTSDEIEQAVTQAITSSAS